MGAVRANLMALVLLGNTWDSLDEGVVFRYADVIGKLLFAIAVSNRPCVAGSGEVSRGTRSLLLYGVLPGQPCSLPADGRTGFAQVTALVFLAWASCIWVLRTVSAFRRIQPSPSSQDQDQIHS
jgi:hypothetical protein